ncbi:hypothetical protein [Streptomyces sp. NPDC046197]|uniref:hypothetical protein n=1 Tax=Streptomyces sp. NPDC046197 TaxID=3154337 RepID=UPI0033E3A5CB
MGSKYTKRYTEEFKRDAIALVDSSGKTVTAVARGLLREGQRPVSELYRLIHAEKAAYPIVLLCRVLKVARSSYYACARARPPAALVRPPTTRSRTRSPCCTLPPATGLRAAVNTQKPRLDGGDQPGPQGGDMRRAVASRRKAPWGFSRTIVPMGYG